MSALGNAAQPRDWFRQCAEKICTAEQAAAAVQSGNALFIGMMGNLPIDFAQALVARASELAGVRVYHHLSLFPWADLAPSKSLRHITMFSTPADRNAIADGRSDYLPIGSWCEDQLNRNHPSIDIAVVSLSPPDDEGYMSFGSGLWLNGLFARRAGRVFAEIDEGFIRTDGDNRIHISMIERLWVRNGASPRRPPRPLNVETERLAKIICQSVADNLIKDRDCIQIGGGEITTRLSAHLSGLNDIGMQTEIIPSGVLKLIERGVITGRYKEIGPRKVVASAITCPEEEAIRFNDHPSVELWDFTRSNDVRLLSRLTNFKAINNALEVDLGGQIAAETVGTRVHSGPGGQTAFAIAASYSDGGAAITLLPSSAIVNGVRKSRILPMLTQGAAVTVPRTHVDYIVTEYGIAKVSGRTLRERAEALIAIAHPDFRAELRDAAKRQIR